MFDDEKKDMWHNRFEIAKHVSKAHTRIHKHISDDYILAKLEEHEKEFIVEQLKAAIVCHNTFPKPSARYLQMFGEFDADRISAVEHCRKAADRVLNLMMTQPHMLSILNRNMDSNFILRLLMEMPPDEEHEDDNLSMMEKLKNELKRKKD